MIFKKQMQYFLRGLDGLPHPEKWKPFQMEPQNSGLAKDVDTRSGVLWCHHS